MHFATHVENEREKQESTEGADMKSFAGASQENSERDGEERMDLATNMDKERKEHESTEGADMTVSPAPHGRERDGGRRCAYAMRPYGHCDQHNACP